jgi:hypothetical protein
MLPVTWVEVAKSLDAFRVKLQPVIATAGDRGHVPVSGDVGLRHGAHAGLCEDGEVEGGTKVDGCRVVLMQPF